MTDALREAVRANSRLRKRHAEAVESASTSIATLAEMLADANEEIDRLRAELAQAMAERGRALTVADALEQQIERGRAA